MKNMMVIALSMSLLLLQGCVALEKMTDPERGKQSAGVDRHSAYPIVPRDKYEQLNIFYMLDPESKARDVYNGQTKGGPTTQKPLWETLTDSEKYDLAFKAFYTYEGGDTGKLKLARNRVQDRILSASIGRCNVFKTYLQRDQSDVNFSMGAGATIAGVLGAVLPGVQSARNLAGVAGLFSGLRAEFNQAYYANLAAHVVVRGIDVVQAETFQRIQKDAQSRPISEYTVEAAIKDAIFFDGLCSVISGMEQAAESIRTYADPGLDSLQRVMIRAKQIQLLSKDESIKTLGDLKQYDLSPDSLKLSLVGIPVTRPVSSSDLDSYSVLARLIRERLRLGEAQIDSAAQINAAYIKAKKDDTLDVKATLGTELAAQQKTITDGIQACMQDAAQAADVKTGTAEAKLKAARLIGDLGVTEAQFGIAVSEAKVLGIRATKAIDGAVSDLKAIVAGLKEDELAKADFKVAANVTTFLAALFKGKTASANQTPCAG